MRDLINSEIVDAFVRAFERYQDPGDSFRSCVRHALTEVAPAIVERDARLTEEKRRDDMAEQRELAADRDRAAGAW